MPTPSTRRRPRAYAPSVTAHRKPKPPTTAAPVRVRTLTGADVAALDAIVDARNARGGGRWSREMVMVEKLREGIARDPDAPTGGAP